VKNFGLIISAIKGFHSHIYPKLSYSLALDEKRQALCSLPHPRNERERSTTNLYSCILDHRRAVRQQYALLNVLAAFLGTKASDVNATTS